MGHSYLKRFLLLPEARGKHGGHRVGYNNCPRYLNNSQFVDLAREGWIGCDQRGYARDIFGRLAQPLQSIQRIP